MDTPKPPPRITLPRLRALCNLDAWLLISLGLVLFGAHAPLRADGPLNLPLLATMLQLAAFMFTVAGLQVLLSLLVWPQLNVRELLQHAVQTGDLAAAVVLLGLLLFNGLSMIAFVLWLGATYGNAMGLGLNLGGLSGGTG